MLIGYLEPGQSVVDTHHRSSHFVLNFKSLIWQVLGVKMYEEGHVHDHSVSCTRSLHVMSNQRQWSRSKSCINWDKWYQMIFFSDTRQKIWQLLKVPWWYTSFTRFLQWKTLGTIGAAGSPLVLHRFPWLPSAQSRRVPPSWIAGPMPAIWINSLGSCAAGPWKRSHRGSWNWQPELDV